MPTTYLQNRQMEQSQSFVAVPRERVQFCMGQGYERTLQKIQEEQTKVSRQIACFCESHEWGQLQLRTKDWAQPGTCPMCHSFIHTPTDLQAAPNIELVWTFKAMASRFAGEPCDEGLAFALPPDETPNSKNNTLDACLAVLALSQCHWHPQRGRLSTAPLYWDWLLVVQQHCFLLRLG